MQSVVLGSLSLLVALSPVVVLVAALSLASWRQRTRLAEPGGAAGGSRSRCRSIAPTP